MVALAAVAVVGAEIAWFLYLGQGAFRLADSAGGASAAAFAVTTPGNTEILADVLFQEYLLPFEIASILLLVAVVGAVVMAKKRI
jgi:NADH:ubiquinone oxidoreductase subunit 6 (subunit J)